MPATACAKSNFLGGTAKDCGRGTRRVMRTMMGRVAKVRLTDICLSASSRKRQADRPRVKVERKLDTRSSAGRLFNRFIGSRKQKLGQADAHFSRRFEIDEESQFTLLRG